MIKSLIATLLVGATVMIPAGGWKKFKGKGFTLEYPVAWELDTSGQVGTTLLLFSPAENDKDPFQENVNLLIQDLKDMGIDLDSFTTISEAQIPGMMKNASILESKRVKSEGNEHHKLIFTADQGDMNMKFEQLYWVKKEKAYILTYTSVKNKFVKFQFEAEKIMNSFKLK